MDRRTGFASTHTIQSAPIAREPSRRESPLFGSAAKTAATGLALIVGGALLGRALSRGRGSAGAEPPDRRRRAARLAHGGSALLSFSATVDSGLEHYRGLYSNRAMYVAPSVSGATLLAALRDAAAPGRSGADSLGVYGSAAVTGALGTAFHVYNVAKRPGGLSLHNLFYAAPFGAPASVALAGVLGATGTQIAGDPAARTPVPSHDALVWTTVGGLAGTVIEVGLLHFRGAYQNPHMTLPIVLPPLAGVALALHARRPSRATRAASEAMLGSVALMGLLGVAFHAYGIKRNMGGFSNWSQMILQGPPVPAPPGFTGLALAGLGALALEDADGRRPRR